MTNCTKASRGQRYPCSAISCGGKVRCRQGNGPNRGQCPVEHWWEIPSVCSSAHPRGGLSQPLNSLRQRGGERHTYGHTDVRMDGISPLCSTGHHPLSGPLPKKYKRNLSFIYYFRILINNKSPKGIKRSAVPLPCDKLWC